VPRAVILSGVRTPIGRYGGALAGVRADDLAGGVGHGGVLHVRHAVQRRRQRLEAVR
jgi:acetyl-CoA acetyltransferase